MSIVEISHGRTGERALSEDQIKDMEAKAAYTSVVETTKQSIASKKQLLQGK